MTDQKTQRRRVARVFPITMAVVILGAAAYVTYGGGSRQTRGIGTGRDVPGEVIATRREGVAKASERTDDEAFAGLSGEILFGDLHVHTTFSADAFLRTLPVAGGSGLHPPADACDYARYCSGLDFFALTDHAETLTPRLWTETKEAVRECNAAARDPENPDLFVFTGFEWTQVGFTPETHYGHKNVIFRDTDEERLPARAIASAGMARQLGSIKQLAGGAWRLPLVPLADFPNRDRYMDLVAFFRENASVDACPEGVDTRDLPATCRETAATPRELFEKLNQWGFESMVIPHGTTWGFYTPPGYAWDKQLAAAEDDPDQQRLVEVFSGHGNSEEYRAYRAVDFDADGRPSCPEASETYEPCCVRAGELVRARCDDPKSAACEAKVADARQAYAEAGVGGHLTIPWATVEDWGECGQCIDCFDPAFNYRPGGSVQYMVARGGFEDPTAPRFHTFGFIASSDNHSARPGTGYKEAHRRHLTEAAGPIDDTWRTRIMGEPVPPGDEADRYTIEDVVSQPGFRQVHLERQMSFFMTGGLVAVHARERTREGIWEALRERRVYGTSGDPILLWFSLAGPGEARPMGSSLELGDTPVFVARAVGAFVQQPGCPSWAVEAAGAERLEKLCMGECFHPTDERRRITRIEVVRIRRQATDDEAIESLIDDPFLVLPCPEDEVACEVRFEDPDYPVVGRDALYYVRAIQEPTPAVNADGLRCDEEGRCEPCHGDFRTPREDDCLAPTEERAWSSPIYLTFVATPPASGDDQP
jgi:hypothetical protein